MLVAVGVIGATACVVDRSPIAAAPLPDIDAVAPQEVDAAMPPLAEDAFVPPIEGDDTGPPVSSVDAAAPCGTEDLRCCPDRQCFGTAVVCHDGMCLGCGDSRDPCCEVGPACTSREDACGSSGFCERCGMEGGPCCAGEDCSGTLTCAMARCVIPPGTRGGTCRSIIDGVCDDDLVCREGLCVACGAAGEPCCLSVDPCPRADYCDIIAGNCKSR